VRQLDMSLDAHELLCLMLWGAETLARPTFRNMTESFEGWAYRRGLLRQLQRLERCELVELKPGAVERIYRLTEFGRLAALGGRDPERQWNRPWDGKWRVVVFDLPEKHNASRVRLRRYLKDCGFGYLQKSLWISPDPLDDEVKKLSALGENVESFLTLEARPCSGESDAAIVAGAWDFSRIGRLHQDCLRLLNHPPQIQPDSGESPDAEKLRRWARRERAAWEAVLRSDPLLPRRLLPEGYPGREVWQLRNGVLREAGRWLCRGSKTCSVRNKFGDRSVNVPSRR
jgi:phenylacetic acid degradation operon negative regulatory protein